MWYGEAQEIHVASRLVNEAWMPRNITVSIYSIEAIITLVTRGSLNWIRCGWAILNMKMDISLHSDVCNVNGDHDIEKALGSLASCGMTYNHRTLFITTVNTGS
jgi:hypothetical protein